MSPRQEGRAAVGIALVVTLAGCGRGPEHVADRFVDAYFVQASQETALVLSTGLATQKLKEELALLSSVRGDKNPLPDARPTIRVHRRAVEVARGVAQVRYDLTVVSPNASSERRALLVLRLASGQWRVSNWSLSDVLPDGSDSARK